MSQERIAPLATTIYFSSLASIMPVGVRVTPLFFWGLDWHPPSLAFAEPVEHGP